MIFIYTSIYSRAETSYSTLPLLQCNQAGDEHAQPAGPDSLLNLIRIDGIIIYLSLESYCSQGMARQAGRTQAVVNAALSRYTI